MLTAAENQKRVFNRHQYGQNLFQTSKVYFVV